MHVYEREICYGENFIYYRVCSTELLFYYSNQNYFQHKITEILPVY